jgi:hypothetical protein
MTPLTLPSPASAERSRLLPVDVLRRQALARLYERRETVENLIRSLEDYQRTKADPTPPCIDISARRKCSSNFSQLQI